MKTMIILPAFNVENEIGKVLETLQLYRGRTIIVDDGSTDRTGDIIKKYGFRCLFHEKNMGVSAALRDGLRLAKKEGYEAAVILDADGQHDPREIRKFEEKLEAGADLVTGNRFSQIEAVPREKICVNTMAALILRQRYQFDFIDMSCGFKAFRLSDQILSVLEKSSSYSFIFDLLMLAFVNQKKIESVKIPCIYPKDQLYFTRSIEMLSFFEAFQRWHRKSYCSRLGLFQLYRQVMREEDFTYVLSEIMFRGVYLKQLQGYQLDMRQLKHWPVMEKSDQKGTI